MKKKCAILILASLLSLVARAQYDPSFSHYFDMETSFNAATVGKEKKLNVSAAYALQMAGFENNPRTMYAAADVPFYFLHSMHGAGVQMMNDQIGLFNHMRLSVEYAYKFKLLGGQMSIGVSGGLLSEKFDGSRVDAEDSSDPALAGSEIKGNALDLGAGIYYSHKYWYVGLSVQHLTAPLITLGESNELKVSRTYYLTAGGNIGLGNPSLTFKPSVLVRSDFAGYRGDINARVVYTHEKRMMYLGLGYSPTNSVTVFVGGNFHGVKLGYSYEFYTNGISAINGSHELCLGYQTDINFTKRGRNKHQVGRLL